MKTIPMSAFGVTAGLIALMALTVEFIPHGCTGPPSPTPCDYFSIAKRAVYGAGYFEPKFELVAFDYGPSAYVVEPSQRGWLIHTPGVLIDKRSCHVCEVHRAYTAWDFSGHPILARLPPERPMAREP